MIEFYIFYAFCGLVWGSFLNVVACRIINDTSIVTPRSHCPACNHTLAWYDLIPVISWILLHGACRYCKQPISFLYPFIELLTASSFVLLALLIDIHYIPAYLILFSALIVSIRTDLEYMLISRYVSLCFIPIGILLSAFGLLPLSITESCMGALFGYTLLWSIAKLFYMVTKKEGLGEGDFELLAMIGSFIGVFGVWMTLSIGSITGSLLSIIYMLISKKGPNTKIPFGPFLALGAIIYVLYNQMIITLLLDL